MIRQTVQHGSGLLILQLRADQWRHLGPPRPPNVTTANVTAGQRTSIGTRCRVRTRTTCRCVRQSRRIRLAACQTPYRATPQP
jgi:hypothetical protein